MRYTAGDLDKRRAPGVHDGSVEQSDKSSARSTSAGVSSAVSPVRISSSSLFATAPDRPRIVIALPRFEICKGFRGDVQKIHIACRSLQSTLREPSCPDCIRIAYRGRRHGAPGIADRSQRKDKGPPRRSRIEPAKSSAISASKEETLMAFQLAPSFSVPGKQKARQPSGQRGVLMGESTEWEQCDDRISTARFCSTVSDPP